MASRGREHLLWCVSRAAFKPQQQFQPSKANSALSLHCLCAEIYSTGKANLPGSTRQRDLLSSFSRMVSELLRHSNRPEVCELVPEHLRLCHRPRVVTRDDAPAIAQSSKESVPPSRAAVSDLFENDSADWLGLEPLGPVSIAEIAQADEEGILDMNGF